MRRKYLHLLWILPLGLAFFAFTLLVTTFRTENIALWILAYVGDWGTSFATLASIAAFAIVAIGLWVSWRSWRSDKDDEKREKVLDWAQEVNEYSRSRRPRAIEHSQNPIEQYIKLVDDSYDALYGPLEQFRSDSTYMMRIAKSLDSEILNLAEKLTKTIQLQELLIAKRFDKEYTREDPVTGKVMARIYRMMNTAAVNLIERLGS